MRKFAHNLLKSICNESADDIEIVGGGTSSVKEYSATEFIIKDIPEWKFYRIYLEYDVFTDSMRFLDVKTSEWKDSGLIHCDEVIPRIRQVVYYETVADENN